VTGSWLARDCTCTVNWAWGRYRCCWRGKYREPGGN
jgi:hypothetical protein